VTDAIFDRTARFYRSVLYAGTITRWAELISATEVVISVNPVWATQPGVQRLLVVLVVILARCFGTITIVGPERVALLITPVLVPKRGRLVAALRRIVSEIRGANFVADRVRHRVRLHVGADPPKRAIQTIAADGWRAMLWGPNAAPRSIHAEPNVVGAVLAALLGSTAVVRSFIEKTTTADPQAAQRGSLIRLTPAIYERYGTPLGTFQLNVWDLFGFEEGPTWSDWDLGQLVFASVGAVNGNLLFILLLAENVGADIDAFEPQRLERSNLNRYWYAISRWVRRRKVKVAEAMSTARLVLRAHRSAVGDDLQPFASGAVVLSGADNDDARYAAQRLARGPLLSVATEGGQVHVSVHPADRGPCVGCLFPGDTVSSPKLPTHPLVSGWAGLLSFVTLLSGSHNLAGQELRISALRPLQVSLERVPIRSNCGLCLGRPSGEASSRA
jgi:hypothetical protein